MKSRIVLAALGMVAAGSAWACAPPVVPKSIPDGRRADREVMLVAKRSIEEYVQQVDAYLSCESDGRKMLEVKALQKVVTNRFNSEVRAFKAVARD